MLSRNYPPEVREAIERELRRRKDLKEKSPEPRDTEVELRQVAELANKGVRLASMFIIGLIGTLRR